jgi:hypothetical protein
MTSRWGRLVDAGEEGLLSRLRDMVFLLFLLLMLLLLLLYNMKSFFINRSFLPQPSTLLLSPDYSCVLFRSCFCSCSCFCGGVVSAKIKSSEQRASDDLFGLIDGFFGGFSFTLAGAGVRVRLFCTN